MKNARMSRSLSLLFLSVIASASLASCSSSNQGDIVLHVLNAEDYINSGSDAEPFAFDDGENEYEFQDVLSGFEEYMLATTGKKVSVVYDTYDTNETMYSSLQTGRTSYDLICASDYMCQKMMREGMLQKIDIETEVPNYAAYCPSYIHNVMSSIVSEDKNFHDYCVDYMWGTLGILYNPSKVASDKGLEEDEVKFAMKSWDALWDPKFKNEMSVKDSMRDTYAIGLMKTYDEQIRALLNESGCFDESFNLIPGKYEEAMEGYNKTFTNDYFNRSDSETVDKVKKTLLELKENVFGFEVDSGKEDMVKGLVGMNLAWSGDAVFSMDTAEEERGIDLYYSIPETGGNIWFDTWVMPKECKGENREFALKFLDFLCDPTVAASNMNYIGYTSAISGESILDLVREWYDPRLGMLYQYDDEAGDYVYDENDEYVPAEGFENGDFRSPDGITTWDSIAEEEGWIIVDLTYMFEGTLDDEYLDEYRDELGELGDTPSTNPYLFYTADLEEITIGGKTTLAGRQFFAQYPSQELLPKLGVMADYGANNKFVLAMWEDVKSNNLPIAGVIIFAIILGAGAVLIALGLIAKFRTRKIKIARRKAVAAARSGK